MVKKEKDMKKLLFATYMLLMGSAAFADVLSLKAPGGNTYALSIDGSSSLDEIRASLEHRSGQPLKFLAMRDGEAVSVNDYGQNYADFLASGRTIVVRKDSSRADSIGKVAPVAVAQPVSKEPVTQPAPVAQPAPAAQPAAVENRFNLEIPGIADPVSVDYNSSDKVADLVQAIWGMIPEENRTDSINDLAILLPDRDGSGMRQSLDLRRKLSSYDLTGLLSVRLLNKDVKAAVDLQSSVDGQGAALRDKWSLQDLFAKAARGEELSDNEKDILAAAEEKAALAAAGLNAADSSRASNIDEQQNQRRDQAATAAENQSSQSELQKALAARRSKNRERSKNGE